VNTRLQAADQSRRSADCGLCRRARDLPAIKENHRGPNQIDRCCHLSSRAQRLERAEFRSNSLLCVIATSVARLRRNRGKPNEARNILAPVLHRLSEYFDSLELREAKARLTKSVCEELLCGVNV
jgi:hypothetical protein